MPKASARFCARTVPLHGSGVDPVASGADIVELQSRVEEVRLDESVVDYLMAIVERTRHHEQLGLGVSPRGSIALYRAAQALALVEGLDYCTPDHVKRLAVSVFAHRSIAEARSSGGNAADRKVEILEEILQSVPVPL